jgi:hypothetical protein
LDEENKRRMTILEVIQCRCSSQIETNALNSKHPVEAWPYCKQLILPDSFDVNAARNRDDLPTLWVTNSSEETQENDLRELFGVFDGVARLYAGRDLRGLALARRPRGKGD